MISEFRWVRIKRKSGSILLDNQQQYLNISRLRDDDLPDFHVGDRIIVEEKIDGANFSFRYDAEKDQICSFSRRVELHAKNTLFGAW